LYPEHLGPEFLEIYDKDIVSVRLAEKVKLKKERDMVIMDGFKLSANGNKMPVDQVIDQIEQSKNGEG